MLLTKLCIAHGAMYKEDFNVLSALNGRKWMKYVHRASMMRIFSLKKKVPLCVHGKVVHGGMMYYLYA